MTALPNANGDAAGSARAQSPLNEQDFVSEARFARRVLFTWTTQDQIDELRRSPVLLTRTESREHGASFFDQTMEQRAAAGDRVASLLRTPSFRRARFAWANPWATVRGWEAEQYGRSLLRVTLKPEAWVARYSTRSREWALHDLNDRPVELSELAAQPSRLAAVYFVHDMLRSPDDPRGTLYSHGGAPYREYVLCNESMIELWEVGSSAVRSAVVTGAALARALGEAMRRGGARPEPWPRESTERWREPCGSDPVIDGYLAAIAFLNERYAPRAENLDAVAQELERSSRDLPELLHRPSETALRPPPAAPAEGGAVQAPRAPPRPRPRLGGTY